MGKLTTASLGEIVHAFVCSRRLTSNVARKCMRWDPKAARVSALSSTFCRSAVNAERTPDRTTAARSRGRQPAASRHGPRSSEPRRRSSAATACWTGRRSLSGSPPRSHDACPGSDSFSALTKRCSKFHQLPHRSMTAPHRGRRTGADVRAQTQQPICGAATACPRRPRTQPTTPSYQPSPEASSEPSAVQRYCRSAAGARGSEATDAPVRLQRPVSQVRSHTLCFRRPGTTCASPSCVPATHRSRRHPPEPLAFPRPNGLRPPNLDPLGR